MPVGGVRAHHQHHVGVLDQIELVGAGRSAEGGFQPVARGRMADAGAGVGVVVAEHPARQFLDQVGFLVGAARGRNNADQFAPVRSLQAAELGGDMGDRLVPADFAPGIGDGRADHRLQDAVAVLRVAPGEAALHAGMPVVGFAGFGRDHAHHRLALHLGAEGAAHAAIGAGGFDRMFRLAERHHRFLDQRPGRAGLHAGAAGDAFRGQERLVHAGDDLGGETAAFDREREGALGFLARTHAARADDAARRIELEIGVGGVDRRVQVVRAGVAVAHRPHADEAGHLMHFAIAGGGCGQGLDRMIGEVQLHHPAPQPAHPLGPGGDLHPRRDGRGAGGGGAATPFDLHETKPAGAERGQAIGGAELGDLDPGFHRRPHHGDPFRHRDRLAVDRQGHVRGGAGLRRAVIGLGQQGHRDLLTPPPARGGGNPRGNGSARSSPDMG